MTSQESSKISSTICGNAISAYLMVLVCIFLLFNKENSNINNDFVKAHVKTAFIIHIAFFITYYIFVSQQLFAKYDLFGTGLNDIIAKIILFFFLWLLIIGMYRAYSGKNYNISKDIYQKQSTKLLDVNHDGMANEKDKMTLILSYIPFLGFQQYGKYSHIPHIQTAVHSNLFFTTILVLLLYFDFSSLFYIWILLYSIFVVFISINVFVRDELVELYVPKILSPLHSYLFIVTLVGYLKNYFWKNEFQKFSCIRNTIYQNYNEEQKSLTNQYNKLPSNTIPKWCIYIPFINLIFLFKKDEKFSYHIRNGLTITLLLSGTIMADILWYISSHIYILFLFPLLFGIGKLNYQTVYKMPYISSLAEILLLLKNMFSKWVKKVNTERKKEVESIGKVEAKNLE